MVGTTSRLLVVVPVAGVVSRTAYEPEINSTEPAAAQEDRYDCASFG